MHREWHRWKKERRENRIETMDDGQRVKSGMSVRDAKRKREKRERERERAKARGTERGERWIFHGIPMLPEAAGVRSSLRNVI